MNEEFFGETLSFDNWDELRNHLDSFYPSWVFRGQRRAKWPLQSSLERVAQSYDPKFRMDLERFFVFQFKRRAHNYLSSSLLPSDEGSSLEWLALMQHHGAPTRLLDFTKSPYVASFFAAEEAEDECAVWAIDTGWCRGEAQLKIIDRCDPIDFKSLDFQLRNPETLCKIVEKVFFETPPISWVLPVEPYRMNERLTVQQGCFLCQGDVGHSFEENLVGSSEPDEVRNYVKKLVMPPETAKEALYDLYSMNINRASLFPGIDGFAQSLKHQIVSRDEEHLVRMLEETLIDEKIEELRKKAARPDPLSSID
ncbi:MAG TPA: FRG domain-containing protein [Desulfomonilaceae bacterium]|nr:FRG domain-containing protein [Desulfomonilaceae bacterium]